MKVNRLATAFLGAAVVIGSMGDNRAEAGPRLAFYHTHTKERISADPDTRRGRAQLNYMLRDFRTGRVAQMSPRLYDIFQDLHTEIKRRTGITPEFHIISGKRDSETNEMLRMTRGGQAKNSLHLSGHAIDIRVPGVSTRTLRDIAWCMTRGGVGYYPDKQFVHIDAGRVRSWGGGKRESGWAARVRCG